MEDTLFLLLILCSITYDSVTRSGRGEVRMADIEQIKTDQHIVEIVDLATEIWNEYYVALTSKEQVDYMLEKFQSVNAIKSQIEEGWKYHLLTG